VAHLHATPGEVAAGLQRGPMSRGLRRTLLSVSALLWLTGALWLLVHFWFPQRNEFGVLPNPWEVPLLRVHGLIAVGAVFLLGWVGAGHISARWSQTANRRSGLWLLACATVLIVSGYALYYTTGVPHESAGVLHESLGLAAIAIALAHWLRVRRAR
jgi:succinate dehydrogenase hydrophobic anchor subunit